MSLAPAAIFGRAIAEIQDSVCMPILLPAKLPAVLQDPEIKLARGLVTPDGYSIALLYDDTTGDAGVAAWFIGSAQFRPVTLRTIVSSDSRMALWVFQSCLVRRAHARGRICGGRRTA